MALFITTGLCFFIFGVAVGMMLMWRWTHPEVEREEELVLLSYEEEVERRRA